MIVGICTVQLWLSDPHSLKDKRRIVKSVTDRVRNRFNVAIAEVDDNDVWQKTTLGVACVGNGTAHVNKILSNVVKFIESSSDYNFMDYSIEIL